MRIILPALFALAAVAGCASYRIYETELDVCSSGNGTVKSAKITKSSGDPKIDAYAVEKVAPSVVYQGSEALTCRPLTVEYRMTGDQASQAGL